MTPSDIEIELWVVYHVRDAPYTVRRWVLRRDQPDPVPMEAEDFPTLEAARESMPPGAVPVNRFPDDDPMIVEVWL